MADTLKNFIKTEFLHRVVIAKTLAETQPLRVNDITFERVTENCIEVSGCTELAEILGKKPDISYYAGTEGYLWRKVSFEFEGVQVFSREYAPLDEIPEGAVISEEEKWST